jgi:hypothetical protein
MRRRTPRDVPVDLDSESRQRIRDIAETIRTYDDRVHDLPCTGEPVMGDMQMIMIRIVMSTP